MKTKRYLRLETRKQRKMAAPFKKTSARHLQPRVDVKVTPDTLYWKNLDVSVF